MDEAGVSDTDTITVCFQSMQEKGGKMTEAYKTVSEY
jgi:hypothetical protein